MTTQTIVILAIIFVIGIMVFFNNKKMNSEEISPDRQVIDQLKKAGSNLSKQHLIEFFLYFPSEDSANRVAKKIQTEGFQSKIEQNHEYNSWLVFATRQMIPVEEELVLIRRNFELLAQNEGGEYDGWGTEIVE